MSARDLRPHGVVADRSGLGNTARLGHGYMTEAAAGSGVAASIGALLSFELDGATGGLVVTTTDTGIRLREDGAGLAPSDNTLIAAARMRPVESARLVVY